MKLMLLFLLLFCVYCAWSLWASEQTQICLDRELKKHDVVIDCLR